ncbi:MAG: hypothetical protein KIS92_23515 [Planctomycetota bacterium]|nr:hypothetical protein [Planctomycetota bacterium]
MPGFRFMQPSEPESPEAVHRRAVAAWYLNDRHRLLWNVPLFICTALLLLALALAGEARSVSKARAENLTELDALKPASIADERNAATLYREAFNARDAASSTAYYRAFGNATPAWGSDVGLDQPAYVNYVEKHAASREKLMAGAELESADWNLNYRGGYAALFTHINQMREMARVMAAAARLEASKGRHPEAARLLGAIYRFGRHLETDPILYSCLASISVTSVADRTLEAILFFHPPERQEYLDGYRSALRTDRGSQAACRRSLRGEIPLMKRTLIMFARGYDDSPEVMGFEVSCLTPIWFGSELHAFDAGAALLQSACDENRCVEGEEMSKVLAQATRGTQVFSQQFLLSSCAVLEAFHRSEADGQKLVLALSVLGFRLRTGAYPKRLEDLVPQDLPEIPKEPWHGRTWVMSKESYGWVEKRPDSNALREIGKCHLRIYSFGSNGRDDGGRCHWIDPDETDHVVVSDDAAIRLPLMEAPAP